MLLSPELYDHPALNLDDRFERGATNITSMGLYVQMVLLWRCFLLLCTLARNCQTTVRCLP